MLVNRQNLPGGITGVNDPTQLDSARLLATQAQFARLPMIAQEALRSEGLQGRSPSDLLGASRVTPSATSDYLTFTVADSSPVDATRLATAYAQQFAAYWRRYQTQQLAAAQHGIRKRLRDLAAAGKSDSALYLSLQETADQLAAMVAVAASAPALVRPATSAGRTASSLHRDIAFALVLALITGVGIAFLRDALDQRARSGHEIEDRLQLRLLGRLPRPPRALRKEGRLVMLADPTSPYAEQFRMLRTTLEFARGASSNGRRTGTERLSQRQGYRLMVTSAVEGEGKSTTVANLAVAFAHAGRNVALVDLDLRRGSLHSLFGLKAGPGITDVILGSATLPSVVSAINVGVGELVEQTRDGTSPGSLRLLPLGTPQLRPADVGGLSAAIGDILGRLGDDSDIVLIDSPPLLRVGDALGLTPYVDSLLVVASLPTLRTPMLGELRRVLDESRAPKLGFVLTGADSDEGYGYGGYGHNRRLLSAG